VHKTQQHLSSLY